MKNKSNVEIMTEYYGVIEDVFGFYLDTIYGYNFLRQRFVQIQQDTSQKLGFQTNYLDSLEMSYGEGDPNDSNSLVFHYATQGEFQNRIDQNGTSYIKIGQLCIRSEENTSELQ